MRISGAGHVPRAPYRSFADADELRTEKTAENAQICGKLVRLTVRDELDAGILGVSPADEPGLDGPGPEVGIDKSRGFQPLEPDVRLLALDPLRRGPAMFHVER